MIMTELDIQKVIYDNEVLVRTVDYLTNRKNELKDKLIKIESVLEWWVNNRMNIYSDSQYGKKEIKELLNDLQRK